MGVGKSPSGRDQPGPTASGPAGRDLRVEGRAGGPAPFLPPIMSPFPASSGGRARWGGQGGRGGCAVSSRGEDPENRGEGGRRAGGAAEFSPEFSSPQGVLSDAPGASSEDTLQAPSLREVCVRVPAPGRPGNCTFPGRHHLLGAGEEKSRPHFPPLLPVFFFFARGRFAT